MMAPSRPYSAPLSQDIISFDMIPIRWLLLLAALTLSVFVQGASSVRAGEVTYPPGSRVGLVPPSGMVTSRGFFGFEDPENNVVIILVALPGKAYADLDKSVTADALKRQGVALQSREPLSLSIGKAFLVIGRQEIEKTRIRKWILVASSPALTALVTVQVPDAAKTRYPDAAIRTALASLAVRAAVPVEEQLGLLPFTVRERAGFAVGGVIPGRAVMLSDAAGEVQAPATGLEPHILVAVGPGGPSQTADRDGFARDVFATTPNLKDVRITTSEPLRMSGQHGHQIIADAKGPAGAALSIVQWLRFGGGGYLQLTGVARAEAWKDAYPRFRLVRDGIEPR